MASTGASDPKTSVFKDKDAWRHALNANLMLSLLPCVRRTAQPRYLERLWLLGLYFATGLFLEHLALLYGPICRSAYDQQCGPDKYEAAAGRRLLDVDQDEVLKVIENTGDSLESEISASRLAVINLLSGHVTLNCQMTKCDHWESVTLPESDETHSGYLSFLYVPGMCRCNSTMLQKVTFRLTAAFASVIFQTILAKIFFIILSTEWESADGWRKSLQNCTLFLLTAVVVGEIVAIWLICFEPEAWIISLGVSAGSLVTISLLLSFSLAHFGISSVKAELKDAPQAEQDGSTKHLLQVGVGQDGLGSS